MSETKIITDGVVTGASEAKLRNPMTLFSYYVGVTPSHLRYFRASSQDRKVKQISGFLEVVSAPHAKTCRAQRM